MKVKGVSNSITTFSNNFFAYVINMIFLGITESVGGKIASCAIMCGCCLLTFILVYYFVPETKDKSNEECILLFQKGSNSKKKIPIDPKQEFKGSNQLEEFEQIQLTQKASNWYINS